MTEMTLPSDVEMLAVDIIVLILFALPSLLIWRGRRFLKSIGAGNASVLLLLGIGILSSTYFIDLYTMLVLPHFVGHASAMDTMTKLHLYYSWYIQLAGIAVTALGIVTLTHAFRTSAARLERNEAYFRTLFDTAPIALFEEDWSGVKAILDALQPSDAAATGARLRREDALLARMASTVRLSNANRSAVHAVGMQDRNALIGSFDGAAHYLASPGMRGIFIESIEGLLAGKPLVVRDGENVSLGDRTVHIRNTTSLPDAYRTTWSRVLRVVEDITLSKQAESRLAHSQKMEAIGQLTGGVAHDFNNLLAIVLGHTELLEARVSATDPAAENLKVIARAVDRGMSLTQRLLAFSRRTALAPVATDMADLITELRNMLHRTLGEGVEIRVAVDADTWPALVDRHQCENALVNLALNARDAMPDGGTLTIDAQNARLDMADLQGLEEVAPGDYVRIAVSDTGTGIDPQIQQRIYEPFFTTKDVGKGTGLGLSMVYGFAKQSGGHVSIDSAVGAGTTVNLYLPRSTQPVARDSRAAGDPVADDGRAHVLIVEDDPDVRNVLVTMLGEHGYATSAARDGREAIEILNMKRPVDLLFTDIVLPGGMSGTVIAKAAKHLQPDIKVLYSSGYAKDAIEADARHDEDVVIVNKPYRRTELLARVQGVLADAAGRAETKQRK